MIFQWVMRMDERCLYERIAEGIRQEILAGRLRVGDRLPSIRKLSHQWNCTAGTIQRAFQELARQGLVTYRYLVEQEPLSSLLG